MERRTRRYIRLRHCPCGAQNAGWGKVLYRQLIKINVKRIRIDCKQNAIAQRERHCPWTLGTDCIEEVMLVLVLQNEPALVRRRRGRRPESMQPYCVMRNPKAVLAWCVPEEAGHQDSTIRVLWQTGEAGFYFGVMGNQEFFW